MSGASFADLVEGARTAPTRASRLGHALAAGYAAVAEGVEHCPFEGDAEAKRSFATGQGLARRVVPATHAAATHAAMEGR